MAHGFSCSMACGIFWDRGVNLCLLHWQLDSYPLRHQEIPSFFFSLNFTYSIWFPVWVLVVCHPIFSVPCAFPNFSSIMIRKKTTIQLTHEQQLILSHKMEPLQVVKIMAFAGKGLPFLKASHRCQPLPSTC